MAGPTYKVNPYSSLRVTAYPAADFSISSEDDDDDELFRRSHLTYTSGLKLSDQEIPQESCAPGEWLTRQVTPVAAPLIGSGLPHTPMMPPLPHLDNNFFFNEFEIEETSSTASLDSPTYLLRGDIAVPSYRLECDPMLSSPMLHMMSSPVLSEFSEFNFTNHGEPEPLPNHGDDYFMHEHQYPQPESIGYCPMCYAGSTRCGYKCDCDKVIGGTRDLLLDADLLDYHSGIEDLMMIPLY